MAATDTRSRGIDGIIISADSHVMEPVDLWKKGVPEKYRETAPLFPPHKLGEGFQRREGGQDPNARIKEMEVDASPRGALSDAPLGSLCSRGCRAGRKLLPPLNDWLIEYCSVARNRLIGIPAISVYDVDNAVKSWNAAATRG